MEEAEIIYIGRRIVNGGKVGHAFVSQAQIDAATAGHEKNAGVKFLSMITERLEREASVFRLKLSPTSVGGVYKHKVEVEGSRIIRMSGGEPAWRRTEERNAEFIAAWKAADDAAYQTTKIKAAERNADGDRALTQAIEVLRGRYQRIAVGNRRGFKLWLLDQLEKR